jgi:methylenetetrahydrofolate dehydrogenase (NADP+) / methenyltetrahydrofolate cyclohydrolase
MILDGKRVSERRLELLAERIEESGLYPRLATVLVGDDPASRLYVRMKHQACERVGIGSVQVDFPASATTDSVLEKIRQLNADPMITGILVQLPLPPQIATDRVIAAVAPQKDVDGFHPCNLGALFSGRPTFVPATPLGIMTLLSEYDISVKGMDAVVIGRSVEVGRPCAALLLNADATVTICHRKTRDLTVAAKRADLLVSAVGKPEFIGPEMVKEGAVVIDVGTSYKDGKLCGDVAFATVKERAAWITPVPGGVGPMTISSLMENTFEAARLRECTPAL